RQRVLASLRDPSLEVRREAAFALGEWGDERAAEILGTVAAGPQRDAAEGVRRAAVAALRTIGGPTAVTALCRAAEGDPSEAVRYTAVFALGDLALRDRPAAVASPGEPTPTRGPIRTRGAVRTRGAASPMVGAPATGRSVLETLQRIRSNEREQE